MKGSINNYGVLCTLWMDICMHVCIAVNLQYNFMYSIQLNSCVYMQSYMYTCASIMYMTACTRSQHTLFSPIDQLLHAQYTCIQWTLYAVCAMIKFISSSSYDGTIVHKSPVFLRTLIRSCDEYTCLSPRPLSHCTLVWCHCVKRQSSPSPSTLTRHHMTATVYRYHDNHVGK